MECKIFEKIFHKIILPKFLILHFEFLIFYAQGETRTPMTLRSLAPEASASANSATWAKLNYFHCLFVSLYQLEIPAKRSLGTLMRATSIPKTRALTT